MFSLKKKGTRFFRLVVLYTSIYDPKFAHFINNLFGFSDF